MHMLRSILVVLAGWAGAGVLVVCTDLVSASLFPSELKEGAMPPEWYSMVRLITNAVYSIIGGWITARLAANNLWQHIWGLAGWGVVLGIAAAIAMWGQVQWWYWIGLIGLWSPAVMLGAWIRSRQTAIG